jgi:hypothetical protein
MSLVARPEDYHEEILKLYTEEDHSQAQIIRYFQEQYGVELKRSTLSDYLKGQSKPARAELLQEDEPERVPPLVGARAEVQGSEDMMLARFAKATADEVIDKLGQLIEGVQQIKMEADTYHKALSGKIDTLDKRLRGEVPRSTLRRIWRRSLGTCGLLFLGFTLWQPTLIANTSLWARGQGEAVWSTVSGWVWGPSAVPAKPARKVTRS